jgi:peptide/nickel transport system permease protein
MSAVLDTPDNRSADALQPLPPPETPWQRFRREFFASKLAVAGLVLLVLVLATAIFAPWISPQNPYDIGKLDIFDSKLPPGSKNADGTMTYWLGTDGQARDVLSAIFYGLRISLLVGVVSVAAALAIGSAVGLTAAYFGGKVDALLMRIVDIQLSFPAILLALILLATLGKGVDKVIIALIAVQWAYFARAARGAALVERAKEYVEAAQCMSLGWGRILCHHMLPNCMPPLIVIATIDLAHAIALEATLSFLGVGVPPTQPSLGTLIRVGNDFLFSGEWWITLFPGVALVVLVLSINLLGDWLRDALNPKLR